MNMKSTGPVNDMDVDTLLQGVEDTLVFLGHNIDPSMFLDSNSVNTDPINDIILLLENLLQRLVAFQPLLHISVPIITELITAIKILVEELTAIEDEMQKQNRCRGRPIICIKESELKYLLELRFTQVQISKLFGCSARTVRRRILEYGLQGVLRFSDMNDDALDEVVTKFVIDFPCAGQKTLSGYLQSKGIHIQRWRIRDSLLRVDPWGVHQRTRGIYTVVSIMY